MRLILKFFKSLGSIFHKKREGDSGNHKACNGSQFEDTALIEGQHLIKQLEEFRDLKVSEVMIPRADIIAVRYDTPLQQLQEKFIKTAFTRMPIYKNTLDEMIGFTHVKDILPYIGFIAEKDKIFLLNKFTRKLIYAPRSMKCIDLLTKMRNNATHMAVILDEYGGTEGIVTIEHLVEEIVGEIKGEHGHKQEGSLIKRISDWEYIIDARTSIQDVEEVLNIDALLSQEEGAYETIGGFVLSYLERIPVKGEKFSYPGGVSIAIIDADPRKIKLLKLTLEHSKKEPPV
ncbi:putative hemolysin C [Alphaproteobacteria bacterium]